MFIFILILIGGAAGYGYYWYRTKLEECQSQYDAGLSNSLNSVDNCLNYSDYYNSVSKCIETAESVFSTLVSKFPGFVLSRIDTRNDRIVDAYSKLFSKLFSECFATLNGSINVDNSCNIIKNAQNLHIKLTKSSNVIASTYHKVISSNEKNFSNLFETIQTKLDEEFYAILKQFGDATNYETILSLIQENITKQTNYIQHFTQYKFKPNNNDKMVICIRDMYERIYNLKNRVQSSDDCYMISDNDYGKQENDFLTYISNLNTESIISTLDNYENAFSSGNLDIVLKAEPYALASYLWHVAMDKPFSIDLFKRASAIYSKIIKDHLTVELLLSEIYYTKQMGGDSIIKNKINGLLDERNGKIREMIRYNVVIDKVGENRQALIDAICKSAMIPYTEAEKIAEGHTSIVKEAIDYNRANSIMYDLNRTGSLVSIQYHHNSSSSLLTTIASGLMWIGSYDSEKQILEYMLSKQLQLSPKQQERLHSLNNGGGDAPKGHSVSSNAEKLYFDISSISWRDDEYKGFFENLAFEEKILQYSVAVRDEDKELMISRRVKLPEQNVVLEKIKKVFDEEYGETVQASICPCCALSGTNQEELSGILVQASECLHLGVLVHMACIGKKFTIKFFTLFMPNATTLTDQKQQLLSLHKKMSPSVTMWENSLKDTILIAFQQLLNELPSSNTVVSNGNDVEF